MKTHQELLENYEKVLELNLKENKQQAKTINISALAIMVGMILGMSAFKPFTELFGVSENIAVILLKFAILAVSMFAYFVLHELVHGLFMKIFGGKKIKYGVKGGFAYAGSADYFGKKQYITIALAPVVLWGIVLLVVMLLIPEKYFWMAYIIQVVNISSSSGDIYVSCKFANLHKDVLIQDTGVVMTVFSNEKEPD